MQTIKKIIVENMRRITLIMIVIILFFSAMVQTFNAQQKAKKDADQIFIQVEQILEENSSALEQVQAEYGMLMTGKNELSYIFSLLQTGIGYSLYAIDPDTWKVVGATEISAAGKDSSEIGIRAELLTSGKTFHANLNGAMSHCFSKEICGNYIVWATPSFEFIRSIIISELLLLAGLVLIALILVYVMAGSVEKTVIEPIKQVNENLRSIQDGNLSTKVEVADSREFLELSTHINNVVASLLETSQELELAKTVELQTAELERQREQLEVAVEQAEAASKTKTEFLFNMSHDLRTPMNAIIGFTNLALESSDPKTQQNYLKYIDVSSKQLLALINNILELSKIENHQTMIEESLVNINVVYDNLRTVFDADLKQKDLTLSSKLSISHSYLHIDTTHYSQIFLNIVSNAIKYTPTGGTISVSLRELPGDTPDICTIETVVNDNGIGMSEEFLAHAFESFARERNSTISGIQGTGLGLTIVKNLVDMMKGTIQIKSQQGKGTTVIICLPHRIGQAPTKKGLETSESNDFALLKDKEILMAEDIDVNAMVATKILSKSGCHVERAKDGVECVDMLLKADKDYYDLVLMDIQMPNMDGYQAAQTIRSFDDKEKAHVPILAMTANAFKEDQEKAMSVGMNGHIAKPIDPKKLYQAMTDALKEEQE